MVVRNDQIDQHRDAEGKQVFPQGVVGGQPAEEGAQLPENANRTPPVRRDEGTNKEYDAWDDDGNEGHPTYDLGAAPGEQPTSRGEPEKPRNEQSNTERSQLEEWIRTAAGRENMDE